MVNKAAHNPMHKKNTQYLDGVAVKQEHLSHVEGYHVDTDIFIHIW